MRLDTLMKFHVSGFLILGSWVASADVRDIELRRLFEPTPAEVQSEKSGRIYIYEGMRESDISRAMEEEFDRVDSMMFIRTQRPVRVPSVTNDSKDPSKKKAAPITYVYDSDC